MFLHQLRSFREEVAMELDATDDLIKYVDEHELPDGVIELMEARLNEVRYGDPSRY